MARSRRSKELSPPLRRCCSCRCCAVVGALLILLAAIALASLPAANSGTSLTSAEWQRVGGGLGGGRVGGGGRAAAEEVDTDPAEECARRMHLGDCQVDHALSSRCRATCAAAPHLAKCTGWRRAGICVRASAFMLVHCPGVCPDSSVQCSRQPPGDMDARCASRAAQGGCYKTGAVIQSVAKSFLGRCFLSCGKAILAPVFSLLRICHTPVLLPVCHNAHFCFFSLVTQAPPPSAPHPIFARRMRSSCSMPSSRRRLTCPNFRPRHRSPWRERWETASRSRSKGGATKGGATGAIG